MTPVHIFGLVVATLVVGAVGGGLAMLNLKQREKYRRHRGRFFGLATEIIRLDDSPIEIAFLLRSLGATMDDFSSLFLLVLRAAFNYSPPVRDDHLDKLLAGADGAPRHVKKKFVRAYEEAVTTVSYRSILFGGLIRRDLCKPPRKPDGFIPGVLSGLVHRGEKHSKNSVLEQISGMAA